MTVVDSPAVPQPMSGSDIDHEAAVRQMGWVWLMVGVVLYLAAGAAVYRPSMSGSGLVMGVTAPIAVVAVIVGSLSQHSTAFRRRLIATLVHIAAWSVLVFVNDTWTIVSFVVYALCFGIGERSGVALAALVSVIWAGAWLVSDAPAFALAVPFGVWVVSSMLAVTIHRSEVANQAQADLIRRLEQSQRDLATAEHDRGVLEERSRFAGEIHDTLAQGFTSIVLLSRAAQRTGNAHDALAAIEQTAQQNLGAARRLVADGVPRSLAGGSLADAVSRQVERFAARGSTAVRVEGVQRTLPGSVEVVVLRAAQVALSNIEQHAKASRVDVTLSYLDDAVVLDVSDDGCGFVEGSVADRGDLTGGHGLALLASRVETVDGTLTIESSPGSGCVVSVHVPVQL